MKKFMSLLTLALVCSSMFAFSLADNYYVVSTGEKLYCKKISLGAEFTKVVLQNGEETTVPTSQIKMYQINDKIFEKLPVYVNNIKTDRQEFMEFISTRGGLRLYKYTGYENIEGAKTNSSKKVKRFYVFKGDQFYVEVTEKNGPSLFDYFGV
jgi:hypothetical protein